ncbi:hypothetical protein GCM10029992_09630 [Glycomyces albus]
MPDQQKPARRHHIVSKFYLRQFASPKQRIMRLPLKGKAHTQSIKDATVQNDFYTVLRDGVTKDAFEGQLADVEAQAAPAFASILRDRVWPPDRECKGAVALWIALQFLRGEGNRRMVEELHRAVTKLDVGLSTTSQLRERLQVPSEVPDTEVEKVRAQMLATADTRPIDHYEHLASIGDVLEPAFKAVFERGPWVLVEFPGDVLGTSDTPVVLVPYPADMAVGKGVGIGSAQELYVPLSSRTALLIGEPGGTNPDTQTAGSADLTHQLNERILHTARRALYFLPGTDPFASFILPEPRQQELGIDHDQINGWIEKAVLRRGGPSGPRPPEG